jgi:hypothetical protein
MTFLFSVAGGVACCTSFVLPIINKQRKLNYYFISQYFSTSLNSNGEYNSSQSQSILQKWGELRQSNDLNEPLRDSSYSSVI